MTMDLLRPGSQVSICGDIEARLSSVQIHVGLRVSYKCFWFENKTRHTGWFDQEVVLSRGPEETFPVGFKTEIRQKDKA